MKYVQQIKTCRVTGVQRKAFVAVGRDVDCRLEGKAYTYPEMQKEFGVSRDTARHRINNCRAWWRKAETSKNSKELRERRLSTWGVPNLNIFTTLRFER